MSTETLLPGWPVAPREEWAATYCRLFRAEVALLVKAACRTIGKAAWLRGNPNGRLDGRRRTARRLLEPHRASERRPARRSADMPLGPRRV